MQVNEITEDDGKGWDTGDEDVDAALDALEELEVALFDVATRLRGDHPANALLSRLGDELPVADDLLSVVGDGEELNRDVALLDRMLRDGGLETAGELTGEMVAELGRAAAHAAAMLRECLGEVA